MAVVSVITVEKRRWEAAMDIWAVVLVFGPRQRQPNPFVVVCGLRAVCVVWTKVGSRL